MLDKDALSKLTQLKKDIIDSKDIADGTVRGTQSRFGFLELGDGRQAFLNPETMLQLLPGDRVRAEITTNAKNKYDAKPLKLIKSELGDFVARYLIKGNNHFVVAEHPQLNRWLFVPPKQRKPHYTSGDYIVANVTRHPFGHGKPQVKIVKFLGKSEQPGIETLVTQAKFELLDEFESSELEETKTIAERAEAISLDAIPEHYSDDTAIPFVTIDAQSTQDMDDALYAEETDTGWLLLSAVADPSLFIEPDSKLDAAARNRCTSVYLTGKVFSMFPAALSEEIFSLKENQVRPALVTQMMINRDGKLTEFSHRYALIKSHKKLSYERVTQFIEQESDSQANDLSDEINRSLNNLVSLSNSRRQWRAINTLVQEETVDYRYQLNDDKKIEAVVKRSPTAAHRIVEEAMLATNICAGELLATQAEKKAVFTSHAGFRAERHNDITQWLRKDFPELSEIPFDAMDGFVRLMSTLQQQEPLAHSTLKRLLRGGELVTTAAPHFGLGFQQYALVTSPIRRYQDLLNHRAIKSVVLNQNKPADIADTMLSHLQQKVVTARQASKALDQWLLCEYLANEVNSTFEAQVITVSSQGLAVRLVENCAESFLVLKNSEKTPAKYDSLRMTLNYCGNTYTVDQIINVKIKKIDGLEKKLILELVEA